MIQIQTFFSPLISCLLLFCFFFSAADCHSAPPDTVSLKRRLDRLIDNGGYVVSRNDSILVSRQDDSPFIPASILKIATSLAALEILGPDFRFQTGFFADTADNLYIKGFGDPLLTSEEITIILKKLQEMNVTGINNIYLDDSAFLLTDSPTSSENTLNPYDAENNALAANFNTIYFQKRQDASIVSAEEQTPTLPLMLRLGKNLRPGKHRINLSINRQDILIHTGQLFRAIQERLEIPGQGTIARKAVSDHAHPLYTHRSSKKLTEIIASLMLYSNNFIANQIFLTCGAESKGYPATWQKSRDVFTSFFSGLGFTQHQINVIEGSGLSRENRVTPEAMFRILQMFKPHARLLAQHKGHFVKSGTLTGVYSYAGYFKMENQLDPFVLILNQRKNSRDQALNFLEKIYLHP
ncbi:MAG: D-alanyl-D-alanine carboxypeptidase [Desulfobulbaceae bacterium]|nr:D-alanyl-D-alanine carboxypeptidase [Desulfobulbaceae bacterium]